jgi:hypothetical protein
MKQTLDRQTVQIYDNDTAYFGADQLWFPKKWHSVSGCGPATAALITMYMARVFSDTCAPLYPYSLPAAKADFTAHMSEVRRFVTPGLMGLKSTAAFAKGTAAFAKARGVNLVPLVVKRDLNMINAFGFIQKAIEQQYMPALLILKNPSRALRDFYWHWMAVTGCDADKKSVYVSTYGKEFELPFELVWQQQKPYEAGCVYFYPG